MNAAEYAIEAHASTNHMYDKYLPYEFHLRMAHQVYLKFKHLLSDQALEYQCGLAVWLHDTIEDARKTYNDIKSPFGKECAEIVRAVTNYGRGRNREERMPDECYIDIKTVPGALFVKLCDRIANVQYGKMTGSGMFYKYQSEQPHFKKMLYTPGENGFKGQLEDMWQYLDELLISK